MGIIGGVDGLMVIYISIVLVLYFLGFIVIVVYSYMVLVLVIIFLVVKYIVSKDELVINMKEMDCFYFMCYEIKNFCWVKIFFLIVFIILVVIIVFSVMLFLGLLLFGNLIKEVGFSISRFF